MGWSRGTESREWEHPATIHRALPAEPGSGADGPHDRRFSYTRVAVACGPSLTAGVAMTSDVKGCQQIFLGLHHVVSLGASEKSEPAICDG